MPNLFGLILRVLYLTQVHYFLKYTLPKYFKQSQKCLKFGLVTLKKMLKASSSISIIHIRKIEWRILVPEIKVGRKFNRRQIGSPKISFFPKKIRTININSISDSANWCQYSNSMEMSSSPNNHLDIFRAKFCYEIFSAQMVPQLAIVKNFIY